MKSGTPAFEYFFAENITSFNIGICLFLGVVGGNLILFVSNYFTC